MLSVVQEIEQPEYDIGVKAENGYFAAFQKAGMKAVTFTGDDAKWYIDTAYKVRWDAAKKVMTPADYEATYKLFKLQ